MIRNTIVLAFTLASVTSNLFAAEVDGMWRGPIRNVVVRVEACGEAICGYIVTSDRLKVNPGLLDENNSNTKLRSRPLKGLTLFYDLKGGPPKWSGGQIYNPDDGHTYTGSVELIGSDKMVLKGCVLSFLCKSQQWFRIREDDAATAPNSNADKSDLQN